MKMDNGLEIPDTLPEYKEFLVDNPKVSTSVEFAIQRNIKYLQMCLNVLPQRIQKEDSNKLAIIYFCVLGLNVLNAQNIGYKNEKHRDEILHWIYRHYTGNGFRGSLTHYLELDQTTNSYDPANISATYFALCILAMMKDEHMTEKIDRLKIMANLRKCQLPNGSFTSVLDIHGNPYGESDLRICFMACAIRKMLLIETLPEDDLLKYDIDLDKLEEFISNCVNFDGGLGGDKHLESHAGYTFCGITALSLINRLRNENKVWDRTVDWLLARQLWFNDSNKKEFKNNDDMMFEDLGGFNGRVNKSADTCYCFWVIGTLNNLMSEKLYHVPALELFLLKTTQNLLVGGFGKYAEELPDPLHSCLGILALKIAGSEHLAQCGPVDSKLVIPEASETFLQNLKW